MESGQPLSSKIPIDRSKMNPYRVLTMVRFIALGFFFHLRLTKPMKDAYGLWLVSVICEIWFAMSWILDQLLKWSPINRQAHLNRLSSRYEKEDEDFCGLAGVDIFVGTEDPQREPPLMTANAILSVLAVDYPAEKVSCYVSDDGSSMLTFDCLSETAEFARQWVPFCKEFNVEPRAPEVYFSQKIDYLKEKLKPGFVKKRREMKKEYEEYKVRIDRLVARARMVPDDGWIMHDGKPWPGNNPRDHPAIIQVFLGPTGAQDAKGKNLPLLVYISREKRPGFHTYYKPSAMNALIRISQVLTNSPYILNMDCTHYINNSKVIREAMCFLMDPQLGQNVCYVQFPLRFHPIHQPHQYANVSHNTLFYSITMKCLDAIQGPICMGNACVIRRQAFYGYAPSLVVQKCSQSWLTCFKFLKSRGDNQNPQISPETFRPPSDIERSLEGLLDELITGPSSLINKVLSSISYSFEENTEWGKEIGWIYGSVTDPILTGMKMHARGWRPYTAFLAGQHSKETVL
ncbi:hypothetical protein SUGI_0780720 [Cryptomeria japonica]|nr:hypothetical protein SUGI_0780720 [Cryptomeria japonica]